MASSGVGNCLCHLPISGQMVTPCRSPRASQVARLSPGPNCLPVRNPPRSIASPPLRQLEKPIRYYLWKATRAPSDLGWVASFTRQSLAPFLRLWMRRLGNSPANSPKVMLRGSLLASSRRANTQLKNKGFLWKPSLKPHLSLMRYFQQWKPRLPPHCRSDVHTLQFSKENRSSLESPELRRGGIVCSIALRCTGGRKKLTRGAG